MKSLAIIALLFASTLFAGAQGLRYGFKAGLNFSNFDGELEQDDAGATVEEFRRITSFHVGVGFSYDFTDYFGARAELLYSQKGVRYAYEGASYHFFNFTNGTSETAIGTRSTTNNIINSYIDLPLVLYVRPFQWLEISAGPSIGLLAGATGLGQTIFSGKAGIVDVQDYSLTIDYNYFRDEAGEADLTNATFVKIGNREVETPSSVGAYYDFAEKDGNYFRALDLGINAGLSFYLSETLYVGGRFNYGLSDVTNNYYDFSQVKTDAANARIPRSDFDRNVSIQASVGFNLGR